MKYDILVPVIKDDLPVLFHILPFWRQFLPIKKVVFIGPEAIKEEVDKIDIFECKYIAEDKIIKLSDVQNIICDYTMGDLASINRSGWYLQQFIKMQYAFFCEDEYYMVWDSDTIPLHSVVMVQNNKPVFHMKEEYNQPYFDTLHQIFGQALVKERGSFISEHMLINCRIMKELIETIWQKDCIEGKTWYEKVLRSINVKNIMFSGFSEYETYGAFTSTFYPDLYEYKTWRSERRGHLFFDIECFDSKDIAWVGREYDALSFEKSINYEMRLKKIFKYKISRIIRFTTYLKMKRLYDFMFRHGGEISNNE